MTTIKSKLTALGHDKKLLNIFTYFRIKKLIKKWRKRAKNSRHRLFVLQQWIATQKSYIKDLQVMQQDIRKPLVNAKNPVITREQQMIMFANVDVIITLSKNMLDTMEKLLKTWDAQKTLIAPALIGLHAFFKIYLQYCNQFSKGQNIVKLIKGNPVVQAIEKKLPLDIASYLIKPVQRPPKYLLLLRDFQKHMPESHPDYLNLSTAIKKYHEVNEINNEAIARQGRVQRMFYLAKLYSELLKSTREFISEFQGELLNKQPVKIYILSDMLLVTKEVDQKQAFFKAILLDGTSFVRRPPDGKYFPNIMFVCGRSDCINLMFVTDHSADKVSEILKGVIEKLFKKDLERRLLMSNVTWKRPEVKVRITLAEQRVEQLSFQPRFRISVEGTERRPLSKMGDETMYIIKYQLSQPWKLLQYVYTPWSTMEEIQKNVRKRFPSIGAINLRPENIKFGIIEQAKESTRITEYRQMVITEFLNYILRCDQLMTNPLSLIETLKINQNLWTLAVDQTKQKCTCHICINQQDTINLDNYINQRWHFIKMAGLIPSQQYCLKKYLNDKTKLLKLPIDQFKSLEKMLLYLDALEGRIQYSQLYHNDRSDVFTVKIMFQNISFKEYLEVKITKDTKVEEVITIIGKDFNMQFMQDFGLFVSSSGFSRLLDGDQILFDVLKDTQMEIKEAKEKGFFWGGISNLKKWGEEALQGKKSAIYIRKYFFFPHHMELQSCHENPQRYMLIIEQILYDIQKGHIKLSKEQYARLSAYFVCIKEFDRIAHVKSSHFPIDRVKQVLPDNKKDLVNDKQWMKDVTAVFEGKKLSIIAVQEKVSKICDEIMKIVKNKPIWRSFTCPAENYDTKEYLQIGANCHNFVVFNKQKTKELLQIPIVHLNYRVTANSIFIEDEDRKYRFDYTLLYNLQKVIERYKLMRKVVVIEGPEP